MQAQAQAALRGTDAASARSRAALGRGRGSGSMWDPDEPLAPLPRRLLRAAAVAGVWAVAALPVAAGLAEVRDRDAAPPSVPRLRDDPRAAPPRVGATSRPRSACTRWPCPSWSRVCSSSASTVWTHARRSARPSTFTGPASGAGRMAALVGRLRGGARAVDPAMVRLLRRAGARVRPLHVHPDSPPSVQVRRVEHLALSA